MKLFIDTWGWLTLRDQNESQHKVVQEYYQTLDDKQSELITSDYVLDETYTLLFRRLPFTKAAESMRLLDEAIDLGEVQLEYINARRFKRAEEIRIRFQDKPKISFTDLTSMVIMSELEIQSILTEDKHFGHVGMNFKLVPPKQ